MMEKSWCDICWGLCKQTCFLTSEDILLIPKKLQLLQFGYCIWPNGHFNDISNYYIIKILSPPLNLALNSAALQPFIHYPLVFNSFSSLHLTRKAPDWRDKSADLGYLHLAPLHLTPLSCTALEWRLTTKVNKDMEENERQIRDHRSLSRLSLGNTICRQAQTKLPQIFAQRSKKEWESERLYVWERDCVSEIECSETCATHERLKWWDAVRGRYRRDKGDRLISLLTVIWWGSISVAVSESGDWNVWLEDHTHTHTMISIAQISESLHHTKLTWETSWETSRCVTKVRHVN